MPPRKERNPVLLDANIILVYDLSRPPLFTSATPPRLQRQLTMLACRHYPARVMKQSRNLALASDVQVSGVQVRACVNRFLLSQVGSQFCAGEVELNGLKQTWRVPILMVTPGFVAGEVGEAIVQAYNCKITKHTDIEEMYAAADQLRKRHHAAIKTAFLRARKG